MSVNRCIRFPGVLGCDDHCSGHFGWQGWDDPFQPEGHFHGSLDSEFCYDPFQHTCTRTPGVCGFNDFAEYISTPPPPPSTDAANELKLLRKVYGSITSHSNQKQYRIKDAKTKKMVDDVDGYLMDRTAYFGGDYATFKQDAMDELRAKPRLRVVIEPPTAVRTKNADVWEEAQTIFYCWVRRGLLQSFESAGKKGVYVPDIVLGGMTDDLKKKLATVRAQYKGAFTAGGYNPRPMKGGGGYRLGTISEHGLGMAVDVNDATNAHIESAARWSSLVAIAGVVAPAKNRKDLWKSKPKDLFDHIKAVNDGYVKKRGEGIEAAKKKDAEAKEKEAKEVKDAKTPADPKKPVVKKKDKTDDDFIKDMMAADANFNSVGFAFIKRWSTGFFTLEWDLVKAFSDAGFLWGATFSTVDIHHFEL